MEPVATFRRLWKLTWLELKIFVREPLGFVGSVGVPVVISLLLATVARPARNAGGNVARLSESVPAFSVLIFTISAVVSLVTIVSIYRESGILKRLRATPLGPAVILSAHVAVKLLLTVVTLVVVGLLGHRFYPVATSVPLLSFGLAVLFACWSILSIGFVIASLVPTARLAQPFAALIFYPQIAMSGLFYPISMLPDPIASVVRRLPLTAATSLIDGVWRGEGWAAHGSDVVTLGVTLLLSLGLSAKIFRWE